MKDSKTHSINKVFLEVHTPSVENAYFLKDNLGLFLKEEVFPFLEDYFDSLNIQLPKNNNLQIENLNLDLSTNASEDLSDIKLQLVKELKKKLELQLELGKNALAENVICSSEERLKLSFLHFLETGTSIWWNRSNRIEAIENKEQFTTLVTNKQVRDELFKGLAKRSFRSRVIKQLDDEKIIAIIESCLLSEEHASHILQKLPILKIKRFLKYITEESRSFSLLQRQVIWDAAIEIVLYAEKAELKSQLITLVETVLRFSTPNYKNSINREVVLELVGNKGKDPVIILDTFKAIVKVLKRELESLPPVQFVKGAENIKIHTKEDAVSERLQKGQEELSNPEEDTTVASSTDYYVQNAGLILLHPFISQLFTHCELLKGTTLVKPEMAMHLLHYIATKQLQQFEHRMVFEKFFCGIPINQPTQRHIVLPYELKNEAEEMLVVALGNWTGMENSSVDLLRNEFLQRPGKVIVTEDNPKIVLERKTQDILLEKISWNLSLIKLPWKEKILFVDW